MLFNSLQFLIFFPIAVLLYYIVPHRVRYIYLFAVSYYFYMCWEPKFVLVLLASTLITWLAGLAVGAVRPSRKRLALALGIILNFSILIFFKYSDFIVLNWNRFTGLLGIKPVSTGFTVLMPIGISFFTFRCVGYLMDVYRGKTPVEKNFIRYGLFVSFFPQLASGPIDRSFNLLAQMKKKVVFCYEGVRDGLLLMLWGYFQKLVLAERLKVFVDTVYNDYQSYSGFYILLATFFFAIQIYCDFASYSNLAIGASKVLGFTSIENFNTPYFANSVADFWRRWHISLSGWFRDYLYIPLGGNRKGKLRKYLNVMIVFLVSGLWHGASWNYVIWGGLNGAFQIIGAALMPLRNKAVELLRIQRKSLGHRLYKVAATFCLINFTWIFFRADGARKAIEIIERMFEDGGANFWIFFDGSLYGLGLDQKDFLVMLFAMLVLFVVSFCNYRGISVRQVISKQWLPWRWLCYLLAIFFVLIYGIYGPAYDAGAFIYFQF